MLFHGYLGGLRPVNREEDAQNAVKAALRMKERLVVINESSASRNPSVGSGIGISYGTATSETSVPSKEWA